MGKKHFSAALAIAAAAAGLAPLQAGAATLSFGHGAADSSITVSACDFEFGAFVNGTPMGSCGAGFGGVVTSSPALGPVEFSGAWADLGATPDGSRRIFLVEPADPTRVSDIVEFAWVRRPIDPSDPFNPTGAAGVNILAHFRSDLAGPLGAVPAGANSADVFVENGQVVLFGGAVSFSEPQYLNGTIVTPAANGVIPEPASVALLGLGLAAMGFGRRRKS